MSDELPKEAPKELPRVDEPAFGKAASQNAASQLDGRPAEAAAAMADQGEAKIPAEIAGKTAAAQTTAVEAVVPAQRLAEAARDVAATAKGLTVAGSHSPAVQGERHLSGPRVITGEVMPPRRSRRRLVLVAVLLALAGGGGY
jgi:membrane fusion protein (multidrug efflux system)